MGRALAGGVVSGARVAEGGTGRVGVLAGDAAQRQGIPPVGRDVDLDGDVVEPEQRDGVGSHRCVDPELDQTQDAGMLAAESQFLAEAIMPSDTWP